MPKISIVIPVYNVEKYLAECLDSVLAQTLTDIEVVCVNDGSKDRSAEILDEYAKKDSRIVAIHQPNGGQSAARNIGVEKIHGNYLLFVDSDDTIHPQLCEKVSNVAERNNADMTFFFADRTKKKQCETVEKIIRNHPVFAVGNQSFRENLTFTSYHATWSRLWKANYFYGYKLQFPLELTHEDLVVGWQALLYSPVVSIVPERFYNHRINPDSLMQNSNRGYGRDIAEVFEWIKQTMVRDGFYAGQWKELFLHKKLSGMLWRYRSLAPQFRENTLAAVKNSIGEDEREYLKHSPALSRRVKDFYFALEGEPVSVMYNTVWKALHKGETVLRKVKRFVLSFNTKTKKAS